MCGDNLPVKTNAAGYGGMKARTGQSNFDITEWMIERLVEAIPEDGDGALLWKTMTAGRVLKSLWRQGRRRTPACCDSTPRLSLMSRQTPVSST